MTEEELKERCRKLNLCSKFNFSGQMTFVHEGEDDEAVASESEIDDLAVEYAAFLTERDPVRYPEGRWSLYVSDEGKRYYLVFNQSRYRVRKGEVRRFHPYTDEETLLEMCTPKISPQEFAEECQRYYLDAKEKYDALQANSPNLYECLDKMPIVKEQDITYPLHGQIISTVKGLKFYFQESIKAEERKVNSNGELLEVDKQLRGREGKWLLYDSCKCHNMLMYIVGERIEEDTDEVKRFTRNVKCFANKSLVSDYSQWYLNGRSVPYDCYVVYGESVNKCKVTNLINSIIDQEGIISTRSSLEAQ